MKNSFDACNSKDLYELICIKPIMKKYLFLSFLLSTLVTYGQNVTFDKKNFPNDLPGYKKAVDSLNYGDALYYDKKSSNDYLALPYYLTAEKFNPNNDELNYKIGVVMLSHNSAVKITSLTYLKKAFDLNPNIAPDIHYYLGRAYHLRSEWETAKQEYTAYLNTLDPTKNPKEIADTKKKIEECNTGEELAKHPIKVTIENLGPNINTEYPEYGVLVNADETEMIFTSKRPETTGSNIDEGSSQYTEDIYISHFVNGAWTKATNSSTSLNSSDNDATAGISADGKTLYIYRGDKGGDLYTAQLVNDSTWSKPIIMNTKLNSKYFETSICVAPDGKIIYFVSERPGGFGGRDIYVIAVDSLGNWGDAQNLGPIINTKYNEEGIAVHPDGKTIYFSSEGHNTMGGYDVFRSHYSGSLKGTLDTKKWSVPENIGSPINTPDDDVFFCISASGKHAYYSSVRDGGVGEKDIYRINFLNIDTANLQPIAKTKLINIMGLVVDSSTHKRIEATIDITDNNTHKVIAHFKSNVTTGQYKVTLPAGGNYQISVNAEGFAPYSDSLEAPVDTGDVNEKTISLQHLEVGTNFSFNNIDFDFGKTTLNTAAKAELDNLIDIFNKHPKLKLSVAAYTDNIGSIEVNLRVSNKRAQAVVDYLTSHGIEANRLSSHGYGKAHPIATNKTKAGRRKNRRTEFTVTGI